MSAAIGHFPFTEGFGNHFLIQGEKLAADEDTVYLQKYSDKHQACDESGQCTHNEINC